MPTNVARGSVLPVVERLFKMWDAAEPEWRSDPPMMMSLPRNECNFLPHRLWSLVAIHDPSVDRLMRLGGGRFGSIYCVPACVSCQACQPSRIDLSRFKFSRSMRRTLNRNRDLEARVGPVEMTEEKFLLFERFVNQQFGTPTEHLVTTDERRAYYDSWHKTEMECTREVSYWMGDRLMAVTTMDVGESGIYSHYCYYDLEVPRRRLGIYTFLKEIEMCTERGWPFLYIGFLNLESKKLTYKTQFSGLEVLTAESGWVPFDGAEKRS